MPELPEVELTARNLSSWLAGRKIVAAAVPRSRIVRGASGAAIERMLVGRRVNGVERRGKWLALRLSGGAALYAHLGMTGKWVTRPRAEGPLPHERARIDTRDRSVRYRDPRMFGRLVPAPEGVAPAEWAALGIDPLRDGLDGERLGAAIAQRSRAVKEVLLDQALIAGVGNIQAQEALFRARIDPRRPTRSLTARELAQLARGIAASIAHTLAVESGPEISYVEEPGAPNPFLIYARQGQPCPRCRTVLQRIVQAGRATVYCPRCQRR
jgi:formamidopyrimidine-DNA glycosylase